jgi:tRNA dimethylallyltransferase
MYSVKEMGEKQKLIIIQGPTGVGKTKIALSLASKLPVEVINADSMQFYRYMDIGTSKPTHEEQKTVPHHLFSIVNPDENFDAARFMRMGREKIADISARNKIPLVVGGAGLYMKALTKGLFTAPKRDEGLRKQFKKEDKKVLFEKLREVDPEASKKINPNDYVRIERALEIFYITGKQLSEYHRKHKFQDTVFNCLKICLTRDRESLYKLIERRVDRMIAMGLLHEAKGLLEKGYSPGLKPFRSIGYKQMVEYIQNQISFENAVLQIKTETKRFAKRQLTWFRHEPDIIWVKLPENECEVEKRAKNFLNIN